MQFDDEDLSLPKKGPSFFDRLKRIGQPKRVAIPTSDSNYEGGVFGANEESRTESAREAFRAGNVEMSKIAHARALEKHNAGGGDYIKAAVFGGLDGIMTSFAVVSSVTGASLSPALVLILGIANLVADGMAMGLGEFAGEKAEIDYANRELRRETWEFDNYAEGEVQEMIDLYVAKGFTVEEATDVLQIMSKHKDVFVDHMMVQELGLMSPDGSESPGKQGLVMFLSFVIFGLIPKLPYMFLFAVDFHGRFDPKFLLACIFTAIAMFTLGAVKAKYSLESWWRSGLMVLVTGAIAAAVAFGIGKGTEHLANQSTGC